MVISWVKLTYHCISNYLIGPGALNYTVQLVHQFITVFG